MPEPLVPPLPFSRLTVSNSALLAHRSSRLTSHHTDQKQARDLVNVLQEAKQQIDPRLAEMTRYGGGGGRGYGGYGRGRGGGRGGGYRGY